MRDVAFPSLVHVVHLRSDHQTSRPTSGPSYGPVGGCRGLPRLSAEDADRKVAYKEEGGTEFVADMKPHTEKMEALAREDALVVNSACSHPAVCAHFCARFFLLLLHYRYSPRTYPT